MKEIYWIQRLDGACTLFEVMLILSIIALILLAVAAFVSWLNGLDGDEDGFFNAKRWVHLAIITLIVAVIGRLFVPTTEEALAIFGLGGTIDYIQDSEKLQQLPDKCVEALDLWVESLTESDKTKKD